MANLYKKRAEEGENKSGGSKYSALSFPGGFKEFKPKEGKGVKNRINILKYKVGSKNHPLVAKGDLAVGDMDFMLTWFEHKVGPDGKRMVCPKRTFGKRCPMCEVKGELMDQGLSWDDEKVKPYNASERSAFFVQDVSGDAAADVEIFSVSSYLFTKHLMAAAGDDEMASEYDDDFVEFAEPGKLGRVVTFKSKTEGQGKTKKTNYDSFGFETRDQKFKQPTADMELPSLDKFLKISTYDEIKAAMEGEEEAEEEEIPKPKKKPAVEEDEEEEAPKPKKKAPVDDEEEEKPKAKKAQVDEDEAPEIDFGDNKCPLDYKWGSADEHPKCSKCDPKIYDACCKACVN